MQTYQNIQGFININLIYGSFISLLVIFLIGLFLKNKSGIPYAAAIIKWMLIAYGLLNLVGWVAIICLNNYALTNRAIGPYWWAYWWMFFVSSILPLTMLFKPIGNKLWFIMMVSLLINFGELFERLTIIITSWHRDYIPSSWSMFYVPVGSLVLQAIIIGLLALFVGNVISKQKAKKLSPSRP